MIKLAKQNQSCTTGFCGRMFPLYIDILSTMHEKSIYFIVRRLKENRVKTSIANGIISIKKN